MRRLRNLAVAVVAVLAAASCAPTMTVSSYRVERGLDGSPTELKGLKKVFVDTAGSREWVDGESHERIVSAINGARLGLEIVTRREDAEVILTFRYDAGTRPQWLQGPYSSLDRAQGEVNVVHASGSLVVMRFKEELRLWKTKLASRFGKAFVRAYKEANGVK